ncbi:mannose-1-phosphate guanylyltransferase/mannose-6-phosphate isomerase [Ralstonia insidiosa]|jgi:mannose-1-phosphate guanylyltransferase/mannose-6-phosphate isomerase|uniref:mannose-1-phosphate guanylyltransferase/mannose-6-phosphate isomerase n=1 Tax=Ralstonia TaxID=48736 RepID=UPI000664B4D2|nr:mannose-1-phosphate guanylyltransferase/mannose-6-phosphate isomerase [Ralstonia insidiosa]KMW47009.1 mannose-1-phosphate guanylyltransferase [Ralstonia sp. MD27]MBX3775500.1 mannose-1-phosphate guanylyltransferase/mannose-6-phosphate isomerase [Ralstonia pickettii]NPA01121.1 mannose-1-phosphate guanylyltransferase/mannose-6-phosphate isomerase [Betaproteobacteria bacterium]MBA9859654.1 mannose-1-phosphate guanylyltransferase/mannose-6-phosphate isomerase [Ralstonia insidiosa]MBA9873232.1 m
MNIYPVILCGGSGTRLWPMSRGGYPKQYLRLTGEHTLVQQTALRLRGIGNVAGPIMITNEDQRFIVAEQMRSIAVEPSAIVLEPMGRDTAPAVAVAALLALQATPDALLLVLPSDHVIQDDAVFGKLATIAAGVAKDNFLVTFGVEPTEPHTGYGYIRGGEALAATDGTYRVERFVEKPDAVTAARLLEEGGYYWNSGMFMLKASAYLDELRQHAPDILRQAELALNAAKRDADFVRLDAEAFGASPKLSIDYAVMEKTAQAAVVKAAGLGWNDIGSWTALAEIANVDNDGNALFGDVLVEDASNTYVRAEHRMVAAVGVKDLVIVETADAILVAHRDRAQDVKKVVERLNSSGRHESITHRKVFRPWGSYEGIDQGDRFQVKRIIVNPGSSLSLQMHHHRAEHWIVVRGTAKVFNGDQVLLLSENQSTYIPLGVTHRLENPGKIPLELIEVQSGSYLGEDDIVRFEDHYGRVA